MFKKILTAALAAGALALNAPVAQADAPRFDCSFDSVQQDTATGQNYEGAAWGYIAHAEGGDVTIRCYIAVNGVEASSTPTGTGSNGAAVTSGRVTFAATDTDSVQLCAEYTSPHASDNVCFESTSTQIPPQEVIDLLISLFETIDATLAPVWSTLTDIEKTYIDPTLCDVLDGIPGTYGPVTINTQGDVFIDGEPFWDCPPYDLFP